MAGKGRDRQASSTSKEIDMTTPTTAIHTAFTTAATAAPAPGADLAGGGLGALGELAGVSPVLAGAYLAYFVIRMLIPAVLIFCTIRVVPASQRSALLQTYLGSAAGSSGPASELTSAQPARTR
jgi:hypothetical protein